MAMPRGTVTPSWVGSWIPDERDGFIWWIRGELVAANAIIDSLCQHLVAIGEQNEYESVISTIQQRQASWFQVLYAQQFYSIADISHSLQQVASKRRQGRRHYSSSDQFGGRRSGPGFNKDRHHGGGYRRGGGAESMVRNKRETKVASDDDQALSVSEVKIVEETESAQEEIVKNHDCNSVSKGNNLSSEETQDEKDKECCSASMAKTFIVQEMYEAKLVNVVEGLKLYEKMVDVNEVSQLVSLANNLRNAGKSGQLQGEAYVRYRPPYKGHEREMIQLGLPIANTIPDDDDDESRIKGRRIEPIPSLLSDIIERFVSKQIIPVKPDACIIDFFNEGDHSQSHKFVPWFGRPVGILALSECDFTFGRVIVFDHPGDYKGSLKLSLTPGSLLLVQGKSADLAKFAIHSIQKQRILITFTKSQPRNSLTGSNWTPPPIVKAPSPQLASPGGVLLPQPRVPISGTGVFLPPGSTEKFNKSIGSNSEEGKMEVKTKDEEACNRSVAAAKEGDDGKTDQLAEEENDIECNF